ncbi:putative elongator complex protein 4 [Dirofilaria immitis]|nr:putative elongator complex protein 4 [Dirofilaria immitis]
MAGIRLDAIPRIPGTNIRSRYPEISAGCAAIDALIGGGIPLSSLYIIDEDKSRIYATVLSKYFSAEGICCEQSLFVASASRNPRELLENLPDRVNAADDNTLKDDVEWSEDSAMKIAWRYSTVPKVDSSLSYSRHGIPQYDLTKKMDHKKMDLCNISYFPDSTESQDELPNYNDLYKRIRQKLEEDEYSATSSKSLKRVLRIIIEGVGNPFWQDPENDLKFVAYLRTVLCSYYAVAMLIINSSGMSNDQKEKLYAYGDLVVHLDAVECNNTIDKFGDRFDGYFRLLKLPTITSIATHCPASSDLVFQLQKRKFDIKVLHLPPALGDDDKKRFWLKLPGNFKIF